MLVIVIKSAEKKEEGFVRMGRVDYLTIGLGRLFHPLYSLG